MTKRPTVIPDFNLRVMSTDGNMHPDWYNFFKDMRNALVNVVDFSNIVPPDPEFTLDEQWPALVPFPANKDYVLIQNNDVEREVVATVTDCDSGTCTATFKVNTTALGGTANSVSSTEQSQAHSTSNVLGVGDDLVMTISSNSSCVEMRVNVKTARTIVVA
ncbi:MAG: hypothetical protein KF810_16845 [Rhizobiaceae bacterium]|nr:hypothetical protein [Rhizobiaceae bacterium]